MFEIYALQRFSSNSGLFILVAAILATAIFPNRSYEHTETPRLRGLRLLGVLQFCL